MDALGARSRLDGPDDRSVERFSGEGDGELMIRERGDSAQVERLVGTLVGRKEEGVKRESTDHEHTEHQE
jgi:hypothetical protein